MNMKTASLAFAGFAIWYAWKTSKKPSGASTSAGVNLFTSSAAQQQQVQSAMQANTSYINANFDAGNLGPNGI